MTLSPGCFGLHTTDPTSRQGGAPILGWTPSSLLLVEESMIWSAGPAAVHQRLEAGDHVKELLVDATLTQTVECAMESLQQVVDVSIGTFHRRQPARVLAGEGFGARPEERDEEIFADERPHCRGATAHDFRHVSRLPGELDQPASPGFVEWQQALIDRRVSRPGSGAVVEEVELGDFTWASLALHENLPDERGDRLDGNRHREESGERQARVREARMNPLADGPDSPGPGQRGDRL